MIAQRETFVHASVITSRILPVMSGINVCSILYEHNWHEYKRRNSRKKKESEK